MGWVLFLRLRLSGLGVLMGGGAPWMGSVGKKFGELRDSPPYVFLRSFRPDSFLGRTCFLMPKCGPGLGSTLSLWFPLCFSWFFTVMLMSCIPLYSFTQSQKRASVLLSDGSQSIASAWNGPTTQIRSAPPISRTLSTPLPTAPLSPSFLTTITTILYALQVL